MYKILKGFHYCLAFPWVIKGGNLRKKLRFTESCKYDLGTEDQFDWNKLIGFSLGLIGPKGHLNPVHWNSVRLGWRYNVKEKKFEISAYCYSEGTRLDTPVLAKVEANQIFAVEILSDDIARLIHLKIDGKILYSYEVPSNAKMGSSAWGWRLKPYFGGNRTSPHKMVVRHDDI